jgi:hypothetical protein
MSARDHTQIEELMAVEALGGLDQEDLQTLNRERAAHEPCDECQNLEAGFAEIAGRLAFSLEPERVDVAMADRILADGSRLAVIPDIGAVPLPDAPDVPPSARGRDRRGRRWAVGVGIAAVLVLLLVASITYLPGIRPVSTHPSATQQFVRFSPADGGTGEGELAMAYTPGSSGVVLWGSDLPDPGTGKVYEVWMISGTTPVSGGCVLPTDGRIATYLDANVDAADLMAVTTEPSACPSAPTTPPILTAPLTA